MIRKIVSGVILPVVICFSLFSCKNNSSTGGKLFILGGGTIQSPVINKIIEVSGLDKGGYGVILPMSSSIPDTAIMETSNYFTSKGLHNVYGINYKKGQPCTQAILDSIINARLVYISGGDQAVFMNIITGTGIKDAIHEAFNRGSLIAGTSAGASLMSKTMVTGNELKHPGPDVNFNTMQAQNVETIEGLGMLEKVIIDQHFIIRKRLNRSICMSIEHPDLMVIGIDEPAAILVEGNMATVYGESQVVVLQNPVGSKVQSGLLGARKIQMDIYLPGERFEIRK
jgi:cyanophycinase